MLRTRRAGPRPCWFSPWLGAARRADGRRRRARFPDARGDTRSPADIVRVTLVHSDRVVVRVHHRDLTFQDGEAPPRVRVIYAVPGHSPGPDYWLKVSYQSDQTVQLRTAGDWGDPAGPWVPGCTGERVRVSSELDVTRVSMPEGLLRQPRADPGERARHPAPGGRRACRRRTRHRQPRPLGGY